MADPLRELLDDEVPSVGAASGTPGTESSVLMDALTSADGVNVLIRFCYDMPILVGAESRYAEEGCCRYCPCLERIDDNGCRYGVVAYIVVHVRSEIRKNTCSSILFSLVCTDSWYSVSYGNLVPVLPIFSIIAKVRWIDLPPPHLRTSPLQCGSAVYRVMHIRLRRSCARHLLRHRCTSVVHLIR